MNGRKVLSRLGWAYTVFFLASTAVQYLIALGGSGCAGAVAEYFME